MKHTIPAALTMIAYALAVLFVGGLTYFVAPPGASAVTALIVSIAAALLASACAVMSLLIESRRTLAMIGIHAGIVLPLVIAAGSFARLRGSLDGAHAFNQAIAQSGGVIVSSQTIQDKSKPHPLAYQSVGIGAVGAISLFGFVTLLLQRPRLSREPAPHAAGSGASASPPRSTDPGDTSFPTI